jgi:hypothetical protein
VHTGALPIVQRVPGLGGRTSTHTPIPAYQHWLHSTLVFISCSLADQPEAGLASGQPTTHLHGSPWLLSQRGTRIDQLSDKLFSARSGRTRSK